MMIPTVSLFLFDGDSDQMWGLMVGPPQSPMKKLPLDFWDTQGFHIVDSIGIPIVSQLYPLILGISPKLRTRSWRITAYSIPFKSPLSKRSTMRKSREVSHYIKNPKYIIYDSQYIPIIFLYLLLYNILYIYIYNQLYCETDGWCLTNHPNDYIPM